MILTIKLISFIFDVLFLITLFTFTIIFYLQIEINFFSKFLIFFSIISLFIKLFYWQITKKNFNKKELINKSNIFLLRSAFCIIFYITPIFYLIQYPNLIIDYKIISMTFFIISILALSIIILEKYLTFKQFTKLKTD